MAHCSEIEHIKKAKKNHKCSWCGERIAIYQPYSRYRYFDGNEASTVKLHPECLEILDATVREEGGVYEFHDGENPRGCNCGFTSGRHKCEEIGNSNSSIHSQSPPVPK